MSISDKIQALETSRQAIATAITQKGGTVAQGDGFSQFATEISNLPSGGSGNPLLTSIDVSDFSGTTFNRATSYITDVTIPSGVTSIGNYAFQYFSNLSSITIPSSVTSIGEWALGNCTSLTDVTIPNNVTSIANNALNGCTGLTSLTIGSSVNTIGSGALSGCSGLTSVTIPSSVTSVGSNAFNNCSSIATVNTSSLADWCSINFNISYSTGTNPISLPNTNRPTLYANGSAITGALTIPNTITSISNGCFYNYSKITSVSIPNTITSIGDYSFQKSGLSGTLILPTSIITIGQTAFQDCTGITGLVSLATTPPTLGYEAIYTGVNYPIYVPAASVDAYKAASNWSYNASRIYPIQQVATVDGNPVYNYDLGMTSTDSITSENMAKMPAGTSLEIAEGITWAGGATAFSNYTNLTLPSTFATFGDQNMLDGLTTVTSKATTPPSAERNQIGGSSLTAIYVPAASVDTYKAAGGWSNYASIIQAIQVQAKLTITFEDDSTYAVPSDGSTTLNNDDLLNAITDSGISLQTVKFEIGEMITELEDIYYEEDDYTSGTFENTSFSELVLPASLTAMGENTFVNGGVSSRGSITFYAVTPPTFTGHLPGTPRQHVTVYVPAESVEAYKTAWSNYASWIQAIPTE